MIESHDGEYPRIYTYKTDAAVIKRMLDLDGQDVCVFPFFGIPVPFSRESPRIVFLPNADAVHMSGQPMTEEAFEQDFDLQEHGFLGPVELQEPAEDDDDDLVEGEFEENDDDKPT